MRRELSLLLAIIMLFGILAGCGQEADERTLSVFELEFSDEAVEELEVAYKKSLLENASFDITNSVEILWEGAKPEQNNPRNGGFLYYGTFDDCAVWFMELGFHGETNFELAGSQFYHHSSCTFYVCTEGKLITLQEAYEQGHISAEDIAIVAARHAEYNEE